MSFGLMKAWPMKSGWGGKEQGCAAGCDGCKPAFGEFVKGPDTGKERDEVKQVAQVGDAPTEDGSE